MRATTSTILASTRTIRWERAFPKQCALQLRQTWPALGWSIGRHHFLSNAYYNFNNPGQHSDDQSETTFNNKCELQLQQSWPALRWWSIGRQLFVSNAHYDLFNPGQHSDDQSGGRFSYTTTSSIPARTRMINRETAFLKDSGCGRGHAWRIWTNRFRVAFPLAIQRKLKNSIVCFNQKTCFPKSEQLFYWFYVVFENQRMP